MTDIDAFYDVREATGNPAHPSVDDVCELVLDRAANPRDDHPDAHFDQDMQVAVDRHGEETIRQAIRLVLVENYTHRMAASKLDIRSIEGIMIGTTAGWFLHELQDD